MASTSEILEIVAKYEVVIGYEPLADEPSFEQFLPQAVESHKIAPDLRLDPQAEADRLKELIGTGKAVMFIPGQEFDAAGTRHGRGGGWYDRFLKEVPAEWIRIGVCSPLQFSSTPLTRESWDEPMDFVCVVGENAVCYETHARDLY